MGDTVFLYLIAAASFAFAVFNGLCLILRHGKTAKIMGTIVSIKSPNAETAKARNSKWAKVTYNVGGHYYTSQNRVQVPMTAQVGSQIMVCYDVRRPEKLYSSSFSKVLISLLITVLCVIAAVFHLV